MRHLSVLSVCLLICTAGAAQAQTVLAPSGDSAITQPGGLEGRAARHNIREAFRDGDVVGPLPKSASRGPERVVGYGTHRAARAVGRCRGGTCRAGLGDRAFDRDL